ncbi:DUF4440 domain-containing protein [Pedobacter yulinensis]|uniref:DUF4440 domain-containing protein n=1 Tax=Pedobacter yulinensis TaxID=2126353 RepID=A0A2T3HNQ8_9SPHI|nr:DUF4440 domain-containing protein [Pedobacter yulinensis]PST84085.1 DUF4440 domain-containing protein [Pedobacter yulinensis]
MRNRNLFSLFVLALLCLGNLTVQAQTAADRRDILSVLDTQRKAWNKGDLETFMQTYQKSDSVLFVGQSGPTYGWQQTLDNYRQGYPDKAAMGTLTFDIRKVEFLAADVAFVLGGWHLKREKDEPKGFFTLLMRKTAQGWKIFVDHSS